ncbi:hypothetical protein [Actinoplanes aureus]|uniref:Uncharacterized protein n=1 Tax=Actinoplanes aureus TaxID=2792083 RepID=A0A931CFB6_9ACTN|nr:hypothetical protein [Actinoplanes aureus]MBG0568835.1 hypothetical protein [Actinoplanes aureus]
MDEELAARIRAAELVAAAGTPAWPAARAGYGELLASQPLDETATRIEQAAPARRDAVRLAELDTWQARIADLIRRHEPARKELAEAGARLSLPRPALTWARMAVQAEQVAYGLAQHPAGVRRDFARIALVLLRETPLRWTPFAGVEPLWVFLDDAGELRVEPGDNGTHEVAERLGDHRCVALVHGNAGERSRLTVTPSTDDAAIAVARHRGGADHEMHLWFTRHGLFRPEISFAPDVGEVIDRAAAG